MSTQAPVSAQQASAQKTSAAEVDGFLTAKDNQRLYRRELRPPSPKAEVAVLHGYADHSGRYLPLLNHLANSGFAASAVDYRGHGQADGRRGHVDRFSEYLDDLDVFLAYLREKAEGRKLFLVAHSHGGLIALLYGITRAAQSPEGGKDGGKVAGVVLSDPYLKLAFAPPRFLVAVSGLLSKTIPFLSVANELKVEMLTRDEAVQKAAAADPLYNHNATPRWFTESNRAQVEVRLRAKEFRWPCLWLLGTDDTIADGKASREIYEKIGSKDKDLIAYEGFRHEVFNEVGHEKAFGDLTRWLEARA